MKIKTSKYNEVSLKEVAKYIHIPTQIVKSKYNNGVLLGEVKFDNGQTQRVYSDEEVRINNVQLPVSGGDESYFDSVIEINAGMEDEIISLGYRYIKNDDDTFDVCYDHAQDSYFSEINKHHVAAVREDENTWYIKGEYDSCEGEYPKKDWTFADALKNQCIEE